MGVRVLFILGDGYISLSACTLNTLILTKTKVELPPSLGWLGISLAGPQAKQKVLSLDDVPS